MISKPDFIFNITPGDIIYDIETYPNVFTIGLKHTITKQQWLFEISFRRNDIRDLCLFIEMCQTQQCRWVGYNNLGFDYPIIHFIYHNQYALWIVNNIYTKAMSIINAQYHERFSHVIQDFKQLVNQVDLCKIYGFDNPTKFTSLKVLEFNMNMCNIEDLPFPIGTMLTIKQADVLIDYMWHDINSTELFYQRSQSQLKLRLELSQSFNKNMINMSDVKIGETILINELEKKGVKCFEYVNNKKCKRQTQRDSIDLSKVIFPYINFETTEFKNIHDYLKSKTITETKGVFKDLIATVNGVDFIFGTGGLHASITSQIICSNDTHQIVDVDVASFYPNLAIKNKLYPAHLGIEFCDAYLDVYNTRKTYEKGTIENGVFKLALNGAYGGSNNDHSPFLDPFYTMSITINGQLSLCMLTEQLLKVPGLRMMQANTDGITYLCPREYLNHTRGVCQWWEKLTQLELKETLYNRMFIRDVNDYIAETKNGKLKRIGVYAYETAEENPCTLELPYHKDWSARVVAKAAEKTLLDSANSITKKLVNTTTVVAKDKVYSTRSSIFNFISDHACVYSFLLRTKVPRSFTLEWGGKKVSNIVRYYISTEGYALEKIMPPAGPEGQYKRANKLTDAYFNNVIAEIGLDVWDERIHTKNKSIYTERRSGICSGWNVQLCNDLTNQDWAQNNYHPHDLNYDWYVKQTEKIVNPLLHGY